MVTSEEALPPVAAVGHALAGGPSLSEGRENSHPSMLVHDRGADVGHLRPLREPIDDKRVEAVRVRNRHVDEEVVAARHDEDSDRLGKLRDPLAERLDVLARRWPDPHRYQRLDASPQSLEVDVGMVAADDAALAERANAFEGGGGRDADRLREIPIGLPCIVLQTRKERQIEFVKIHQRGQHSESSSEV
jgi:hypothetical protein